MSGDDFVGAFATVTLSSDQTLTGTIFAYDQANCALVLLQQPTAERPTVKIINTVFIKNIVIHEKHPKDPANRLPNGVSSGAALPSFGSENLQKKVKKTLTKAEERRQYPSEYPVTIAACQLFDRLMVACGQANFTQDPKLLKIASDRLARAGFQPGKLDHVISINDQVLITDNGNAGDMSWENPFVCDVDEGHDQLVNRVRHACQAAFKS